MEQWEYRFVVLSTLETTRDEPFTVARDHLNQLGEEGWEVVTVILQEKRDESPYLALLKRPKE